MPVFLTTLEAEIQKMKFNVSPGMEFRRPPSQPTAGHSRELLSSQAVWGKGGWAWWHMPVIPMMVGSLRKKDCHPGQPRQNVRPYLQNSQSKKSWRYDSRGRA
jgi:hypothetical protein